MSDQEKEEKALGSDMFERTNAEAGRDESAGPMQAFGEDSIRRVLGVGDAELNAPAAEPQGIPRPAEKLADKSVARDMYGDELLPGHWVACRPDDRKELHIAQVFKVLPRADETGDYKIEIRSRLRIVDVLRAEAVDQFGFVDAGNCQRIQLADLLTDMRGKRARELRRLARQGLKLGVWKGEAAALTAYKLMKRAGKGEGHGKRP